MKIFRITIPAILLFCISSRSVASCGSASCPLNHHHYLSEGFFRLTLSQESITQDRLFLGSSRSSIGAVPLDHDELETVNRRTLFGLEYGITDQLALGFDLPMVLRKHTHIGHEPGGDVTETWNFSGAGDASFSAHYAVLAPVGEFDPYVALSLGIKFPTGKTGQLNADGEEAEVPLQLGSGSTDISLSFHYRRTLGSIRTLGGQAFSAVPLILSTQAVLPGRGTHGYRQGTSLFLHAGTAYQFHESATVLLQANVRLQAKASPGSTAAEDAENTGGTWVFLSPGLNVEMLDGLRAYAFVQIPVYQNVNGLQQTAAYNLQVGFAADVSLFD